MKNSILKTILAGIASVLFLAVSAQAQLPGGATQAKAEIDEVEIQMQDTPEFSGTTSDDKKEPKDREWLEMEMQFETVSDSKVGFIDNLTIKYYLAIAGATPFVLNDTINYINIPDEEEIYTVVYVTPPSLARLVGAKDTFSERDVKAWGVEILFNGQRIAAESSTGSEWWTTTTGTRISGLTQPKEKTPFRLLWIDRHVEAKLDN